MPIRGAHLRLYVLVVIGALLLHELRYALAFGGHADEALAAHGHDHLAVAGPTLGMLAAVGLSVLTLRLADAPAVRPAGTVRMRRLWPLLSAGLLAIFTGQELIERVLAPGHPAGLDGVLGDGGWVALPLSAGLGGVIALTVGIARALATDGTLVAGWLRGLVLRLGAIQASASAALVVVPPGPPPRHRAGRGPPLAGQVVAQPHGSTVVPQT